VDAHGVAALALGVLQPALRIVAIATWDAVALVIAGVLAMHTGAVVLCGWLNMSTLLVSGFTIRLARTVSSCSH
jgi:hypothetical protein